MTGKGLILQHLSNQITSAMKTTFMSPHTEAIYISIFKMHRSLDERACAWDLCPLPITSQKTKQPIHRLQSQSGVPNPQGWLNPLNPLTFKQDCLGPEQEGAWGRLVVLFHSDYGGSVRQREEDCRRPDGVKTHYYSPCMENSNWTRPHREKVKTQTEGSREATETRREEKRGRWKRGGQHL